jgi:hypothetical protein
MALEAQRESAGVGLPMLDLGAIWVWVVNATGWSLYPWKRSGIQRTGWAPGPVSAGVEILACTGI